MSLLFGMRHTITANVGAMRSALCAWVLCALEGVAYSVCWGTAASSCIWSRPLLQGSGLPSVDKRDSEPGQAFCIGSSSVRRSGHHCAITCKARMSSTMRCGIKCWRNGIVAGDFVTWHRNDVLSIVVSTFGNHHNRPTYGRGRREC